jgi:fucose 4-O-acetylase-like acetyltransferase
MKDARHQIRNWCSKAFNLQGLERNRYEWVDYLKGIAILLVVYRHVLIGIERSQVDVPPVLADANMIFYSFRMPLFFILSGLFINSSLAKRTLGQLTWLKFENLLYPYLVWAFIQVSLQIALSGITNSNRGFLDYTYILYQPRNLDQFWYLPALFNTTMIYLLLKKKAKLAHWAQLVLGTGLYFLSFYYQEVSMISDWMEFYVFFALGDAISHFFFRDKTQKVLKSYWTLLLMIPLFIVTQMHYLNNDVEQKGLVPAHNSHASRLDYLDKIAEQTDFLWVALVGCLCMFVLAFRMQSWRVFPFLRVLGYHSLQIYVMHVIFTAFVRLTLIIFFDIRSAGYLLITGIVAGLVFPIVIYNLLIKNNIGWFLFSLQRPQRKEEKEKEKEISRSTRSEVSPVGPTPKLEVRPSSNRQS